MKGRKKAKKEKREREKTTPEVRSSLKKKLKVALYDNSGWET